jgi:hypothetical protein
MRYVEIGGGGGVRIRPKTSNKGLELHGRDLATPFMNSRASDLHVQGRAQDSVMVLNERKRQTFEFFASRQWVRVPVYAVAVSSIPSDPHIAI